MVQYKVKKRGLSPKLQKRYKGPFRVVERVTDVLYKLISVEGGKESVVHFNRLKPFTCSLAEPSKSTMPVPNRSVGVKQPARSHQPKGVRIDASWVPHRRSGQAVLTEQQEQLEHQAGSSLTPEGGHGLPVPAGNRLLPQATVFDETVLDQGPQETQGISRQADPGPSSVEGRPTHQRRPPAWSRDYQMSP